MDQVTMDFQADFAKSCATALEEAGYSPPAAAPAEIIRAYASVRHRRVPQRVRRLHRAAYTVPPHLVAGEKAFEAKVVAGKDLRPHQSTRLDRVDFNDGMLNDFGIQHF